MYLLRLAVKNVFRKAWRSVLTAVPVLVGVFMIIAGWGFIDGIDNAVIEGQIRSDTGHFRVMARGYLEKEEEADLDLLVDDVDAVRKLVAGVGEARLHPRLSFRGELSDGRYGLMARGIGVEPESYFAEFDLPLASHYAGDAQTGLAPMWLGAALAADFGVDPGDTLTVLARTRYGSYTADEYVVDGLVRSGNLAIDNSAFFIPLDAARRLLDCGSAASEIVGFLPRRSLALELPARLAPELERAGLEIETWRQRAEPILRVNRLRRKVLAFMIGIIVLVAATGIANTVVMAGFERIREVGTLRALGLQVESVVFLFLFEALLIGLAGALIGSGLGVGMIHALKDGIDFTRVASTGGMTISSGTVLYLEMNPAHVAGAFVIGVGMTLVAALYPSVRFSRLDPADAMKN